MSRLLELDQVCIEYPEIQKYLANTANESSDFFRKNERLDEEIFFRTKSYVYAQLNMFDEILSLSTIESSIPLQKQPELIEIGDWHAYIKHRLTHPLYQSILNNEIQIFGASVDAFWNTFKKEIFTNASDPFSW